MTGNVFLVGLMGAGKTTVGRQLARHLKKTFLDADHEIEKRTGVNIPTIFELEGEPGFRSRETAMIAELTGMRDIILATGGGAVLNEQNRCKLKENGIVIYLRAKVEDLYIRTRHDRNRPLLQTADPRQRLQDLYDQRDPLYREVADLVVDTGEQSIHALVKHIEAALMKTS